MARPKTKPGRLSDLARHLVQPAGISSTGWPAVRDKCAEWGDCFDEWQDGAGRLILAKREDGIYAATVGGVTLSIPRQVAKTFLVGRIIFALCALFPGLKVLWTAHRTRTATNTFRSLQGYARRRKVAPYIKHIRTANGEQEIAFRNGSVIMFGAREQGFGRGFDEVDVEVFDEAQILTEKALEDMIAATNQARHVHGALLFFMGTPPRPVDPGEAFTIRRRKAIGLTPEAQVRRTDGDMVYIEFSADDDADLDDRKQWAKANPSYPNRTPLESMLRLRENLPSDDAWRREALGIWDSEDAALGPIDVAEWGRLRNAKAKQPKRSVLAIDVSPDRRSAAIGVAGEGAEGRKLIMVRHSPGTSWVVREVAKIIGKRDVVEVVLHPGSQAGALIPDLVREGVDFTALTSVELSQACALFQEDVKHRRLEHVGQAPLDAAVANARTRRYGAGESERWDRREPGIDISPLVAASMAAFAWAGHAGTDYDLLDSIL